MSESPETTTEICVQYEQNFNDWRESLISVGLLSSSPYAPMLWGAMTCALLAAISWSEQNVLLGSVHTALTLAFLWAALNAQRFVENRLRKSWRSSRVPNLVIRACFSDEKVTIDTEHTHTVMAWSIFIRHLETEQLFICIIGTGNILALPKKAMSAREQGLLRSTLIRNVIPQEDLPTFGFPVVQKNNEKSP